MQRTAYLQQIVQVSKVFPIVVLLGPRQCGKTTGTIWHNLYPNSRLILGILEYILAICALTVAARYIRL